MTQLLLRRVPAITIAGLGEYNYQPPQWRLASLCLFAVLFTQTISAVPLFLKLVLGKVREVTVLRVTSFHASIHTCLTRK